MFLVMHKYCLTSAEAFKTTAFAKNKISNTYLQKRQSVRIRTQPKQCKSVTWAHDKIFIAYG